MDNEGRPRDAFEPGSGSRVECLKFDGFGDPVGLCGEGEGAEVRFERLVLLLLVGAALLLEVLGISCCGVQTLSSVEVFEGSTIDNIGCALERPLSLRVGENPFNQGSGVMQL